MLKKCIAPIFFSALLILAIPGKSQNYTVTPKNWYKGQTLTVSISGYKTNFKTGTGTSVVKFTQGTNTTILPNYFTVVNDTSISAGFTVSNFVPTGFYNGYILDAQDGAITQANAIFVNNKLFPYLTKVYPDTLRLGQTLPVAISGQNTNFGVGTSTTSVWFQQGTTTIINPYSVVANSSTNLTANTFVPTGAKTGYYDTYALNSIDGKMNLNRSIYISPAALPFIKSFTPDSAQVGQVVKLNITGANTRFGYGQNATYATLSLATNSKDTLFGYSNSINSINNMECYFTIPANADTGYYNLNIFDTYDGHLVSSAKFHIYKLLTRILSIKPASTTVGTTLSVVVTGYNTNFKSGTGTIVWFNQGTQTIYASKNTPVASDTVYSDFTIPTTANTGYYNVNTSDSIDGNLSLQNGFYIYPKSIPRIAGINPSQTSAAGNFSPTINTYATKYTSAGIKSIWLSQGSVKISATNNLVKNDTTLQSKFYIPYTASGYYNLYVLSFKGDTLSLPNAVNVFPVSPFIASVSPKSATQKQSVSISLTGKYTSFTSGSVIVWLSNSSNTIYPGGATVYTDSLVNSSFLIPPKAVTGYWDVNVKDKKDNTLTLSKGFYINPAPTAVIVSVDPDSAEQSKTILVKIVGSNTKFSSGGIAAWLTKGSATINSNTINALNDSSVFAGFTIPSAAALGYYDVNVSDALDGNLLKSNGFLVTHNSGISPGNNPEFSVNVYPNPFESNIQVEYTMENNRPVAIDLYNITGEKIMSESYGNQPAGSYIRVLNLNGRAIKPGVYFIRLQAGEYQKTVKVFKMD